jgi:hypothetical protein
MEQVLVKDTSHPDYVLSKELLEEFWEWFCYFLRVHPSAHENVPRETIEFWRERLDWETERYARILGDHIVQASFKDHSLDKDPVLGDRALRKRQRRMTLFRCSMTTSKGLKTSLSRQERELQRGSG